ncbi:Hypothetical predicted protein [Mytilus galloprovincialis]|uniref:Uncharacterized protein n=1 Tax=Mytilus galloprovincialis TaxID=29158 RepID=A0A8B6CJB7_MYTGA|nr:Hypothetical predicted protein [Mytilus galloprovincialis]
MGALDIDSDYKSNTTQRADFYWDFIEDIVIRGKGLTAVKCKLGYLLPGSTSPDLNRKSGAVGMFNILTNHQPEEFNLEAFWKLESLGVVDTEPEDENIDFMNMYQKTSVEFYHNRYIAKLPWKQDHETLPTNFVITKQRTENVVKRLSQDPHMLQTQDQDRPLAYISTDINDNDIVNTGSPTIWSSYYICTISTN